MGRPVVNGREVIYRNGKLVGICLGHGGYSEHHIINNACYVGQFNKHLDKEALLFFLPKEYSDITLAKQIEKESKDDITFLRIQLMNNKDTVYVQYYDYILRPHLSYFEKEIELNNNTFEGVPGLSTGKHVYMSIEGLLSWGHSALLFKNRYNSLNPLIESDIFHSQDYNHSPFHEPSTFMSSWADQHDNLVLVMNEQLANEALPIIKTSLQNGYLALVYGAFHEEALSLVFVDKLMETLGQTPIYTANKPEKKFSFGKMKLF